MRTNGAGKPVVALDIDGTLGDYHGNFITFAQRYFDKEFRSPLENNPGLPLWEFLGLSRREYRDAKLAYRQGGWKRWMPCYPGASELTKSIRGWGAEVWICTTRPYLRLDNVDPDTREWMRRNAIEYDAVIFDPLDEEITKYDELARQAGSRLASVVEDLPEMIVAAYGLSPRSPILRDQPYNRQVSWERRAMDLWQVKAMVAQDLRYWKREIDV